MYVNSLYGSDYILYVYMDQTLRTVHHVIAVTKSYGHTRLEVDLAFARAPAALDVALE